MHIAPEQSPTSRSTLIPSISAGVVIGIVNTLVSISLAALIFGGELSQFVANGIGLILLGGLPALILVGTFSSYRGSVSLTQDAPAAILAIMAAGIVNALPDASPNEQFVTVVAMVVVTSLTTGVVFVVLGRFNLGSLVRFLPYPVIGGFLAGTGWLLVIGGIGVMADITFSFAEIDRLLQYDTLLQWVPGLALGILILAILNRYDHFLVLPSLLLATVALFYGVTAAFGLSPDMLSEQGWLLGPFAAGNLWQPIPVSQLAQIRWEAVLGQAGSIASILMISVVSLLLNASGIELIVRQDVDLNQELRIAGWGNIAGSFLGGIVSYHGLTNTSINHKIGGGSRAGSWIAAVVFALPLLIGAAALSYIPKITLGTVLILFGLSFLYEWVYLARARFSRLEFGIILLILGSIATLGYLQGVGIGILAAVGLFVVNYSQISVTKHMLSGAELRSRFTRSLKQRKFLMEQGEQTLILQLQGFIFFGTANKLLGQVNDRLEQSNLTALKYLILDFAKVSGLDSTAMLSFSKMKQMLTDRGIIILVTGSSAEIVHQLNQGGFIEDQSDSVLLFPDLDHGLEWVENAILHTAGILSKQSLTLKEILYELVPDEIHLNGLFAFLERLEVDTGDYLMQQADEPDNVYIVESGQVTAQLEYADRRPLRLESMKSGRVIGELGFYLGQKRTAAVIVDEPSVVYLLTAANLSRMEAEAPKIASYFHRVIIQLLSERTTHLIRVVSALEK